LLHRGFMRRMELRDPFAPLFPKEARQQNLW
jgi:hypothetical protein